MQNNRLFGSLIVQLQLAMRTSAASQPPSVARQNIVVRCASIAVHDTRSSNASDDTLSTKAKANDMTKAHSYSTPHDPSTLAL